MGGNKIKILKADFDFSQRGMKERKKDEKRIQGFSLSCHIRRELFSPFLFAFHLFFCYIFVLTVSGYFFLVFPFFLHCPYLAGASTLRPDGGREQKTFRLVDCRRRISSQLRQRARGKEKKYQRQEAKTE